MTLQNLLKLKILKNIAIFFLSETVIKRDAEFSNIALYIQANFEKIKSYHQCVLTNDSYDMFKLSAIDSKEVPFMIILPGQQELKVFMEEHSIKAREQLAKLQKNWNRKLQSFPILLRRSIIMVKK